MNFKKVLNYSKSWLFIKSNKEVFDNNQLIKSDVLNPDINLMYLYFIVEEKTTEEILYVFCIFFFFSIIIYVFYVIKYE